MTDKITFTTELIGTWKRDWIDSEYFQNTLRCSDVSEINTIIDIAQMAEDLNHIIKQVKNNPDNTDIDMIKEYLENDMKKVLEHYENIRRKDKEFKNIKDFLSKLDALES